MCTYSDRRAIISLGLFLYCPAGQPVQPPPSTSPRLSLPPPPPRTYNITKKGGRFGDSSEVGCELEVPQDALHPDVDQLDVTIQPHISNSKISMAVIAYTGVVGIDPLSEGLNKRPLSEGLNKRPLPEGTELVSGVYEMQSREVRLSKPVSFTCKHCCDVPDEELASLCAVRARGQGRFEPVDDSQVEIRSSSVVLKLTELATACYAVVATVAARRFVGYCGILYRLQKEGKMATSMTFHFIVVKDLNVCIKVRII